MTDIAKDNLDWAPGQGAGAGNGTTEPAGAPEPAPDTAGAAATESLPTAAELEALRAKAAKADEHWDRLLRQSAEYENFKKRAARERQEAVKYANEGLLVKLITTLDHFDMALAASNAGANATVDSIRTGVTMIQSQLRQTLVDAGLEEIDATGQPFNPAWHEAVSQQESAAVPEGHVLQQIRKGYRLRERLLRAASVIVARAPSPAAADGQPGAS